MTSRHRDAVAIAALVGIKVAAMAYALHCGFAQVSDDDYARTVIAQTFAHSPRFDPSGTSWLPFPFWLYGSVMMVFGRSLAVARGLAFVLGALSPALIYFGLRSMPTERPAAVLGTAVASLTPWSVWLALAPVPEGWAGACAASALFFLASKTPWRGVVAGVLALVSSLSRYEAWPIAALVAITCGVHVARTREARGAFFAGSALALLGPALWVANNAYAHHDAFHFIVRVTSFHRENVGTSTLLERLLEYPRALVHDAGDVVLAGVVGASVIARRPAMRAQWVLPLAGMVMVFAFLTYGALREGAPTHHSVRALVPVITAVGSLGGVGAASMVRCRTAVATAIATWLLYVGIRTRDVPGASDGEQRNAQIEHGQALATSAGLDVTPCAYEHFALIAAYGAPERVIVKPQTHELVSVDCPHVAIR